MAQTAFKGSPVHTSGNLPAVGSKAPDFKLTKTDLADVSLKDFAGKKVILNIFPSIDTPTCAASTRKFNQEAAKLPNTVILGVSKDLPFAHKRFCAAEGIDKVVPTTELRDTSFGQAYGVRITDTVLAGLFARAIVVVDENGKVAHTELVSEIANEPNYQAALNALKQPA
jgi:thioredoxin-dependent peroxiredoxin